MEQYKKGNKILNYIIIKTDKRKEYYLTKIEDSIVYLFVPSYAEDKDIKTVLSQQFYVLYNKIHPEERYFVHFKGEKYSIKCIKSNVDEVIVNKKEIIVKATKVTSRYFKSLLYKYFARIVEEELTKLIYEAQHDFKEITIPPISVKPLTKYLGYNYIDHIIINPIIAKYDPKFIKVLLYHEICHSLIRGHRQNFWDLLNNKLENGRILNDEMNAIVYNDYL